jgi:hypothetical protein
MSIVHDFEQAFNRQDVKALLDCFTEDASYHDNFDGAHSGQVGLRAMFERMFHEGRDYAWKMDVIVDAPTRAAAEWTFSYVVTDAIPRSAGRKIGFRRDESLRASQRKDPCLPRVLGHGSRVVAARLQAGRGGEGLGAPAPGLGCSPR